MGASSDRDERPLLERLRGGRRPPQRLLDVDDARRVDLAVHVAAVTVVASLSSGEATLDDVYAFALAHPVADYAEELLAPGRFDGAAAARLRPNVRWLRRTARDAEPVKLAIVLTGAVGDERDIDELVVLGADEELTLLACEAIERLSNDPTDALMAIARTAEGWGLIEVVERLASRPVPAHGDREWLIAVVGDRVDVAEQLAAPAAVAGRFVETVVRTAPDGVLDGAAAIIVAVARAADETARAPLARAFLKAVNGRCDRLARVDALVSISQFGDGAAARATTILTTPAVQDLVRTAFLKGPSSERALALRLAPSVSIDLWDAACAALRREPHDASLAFTMLHDPTTARVQETLAVLADQPAVRLTDRVLDEVLRRLAAGDVVCTSLIDAGQVSANPRIRELAARASGP